MKEYSRELKQWVEKGTAGSLKRRELCKGGREHDWILCLPSYIPLLDSNSVLGLDKVEEYYKIEDEKEDAELAFDKRLKAIGIKTGPFRITRLLGRRRSYICSVCLKQK